MKKKNEKKNPDVKEKEMSKTVALGIENILLHLIRNLDLHLSDEVHDKITIHCLNISLSDDSQSRL